LWADRLDEYGPNITEWGSVAFVVEKLRQIANGIETAVRDVGILRAHPSAVVVGADQQEPIVGGIPRVLELLAEFGITDTDTLKHTLEDEQRWRKEQFTSPALPDPGSPEREKERTERR
jgi:hypothetical protein